MKTRRADAAMLAEEPIASLRFGLLFSSLTLRARSTMGCVAAFIAPIGGKHG
jgi:hypothetical protein